MSDYKTIQILLFFFNLWWILSYIEMKQPWVYMCSPSQSQILLIYLCFVKDSPSPNIVTWEVNVSDISEFIVLVLPIDIYKLALEKVFYLRIPLNLTVKVLVTQVVPDSVTPWTVAHQAPLSMGFSRQEYWSGLPRTPSGDLPDPGIKHMSCIAGRFFAIWATRDRVSYIYLLPTNLLNL